MKLCGPITQEQVWGATPKQTKILDLVGVAQNISDDSNT